MHGVSKGAMNRIKHSQRGTYPLRCADRLEANGALRIHVKVDIQQAAHKRQPR